MSDFDPYRKWLGIKPEEQPPNHYRLLGISAFEDDPDVIDAAVEQRVTFLQSCASGPNLKHSQKLLNEVAEARNDLLDAEKKEAYDAELKAKQAEPKQLSADQATSDGAKPADWKARRKTVADDSLTSPPPAQKAPSDSGSKPVVSVAAQLKKRRSRSTGMIVAVVLAVGATGGFLWWLVNGDGTEVLEEIGQTASGEHDSTEGTGGEGETSTGGETGGESETGTTGGESTAQTGTGTGTNPKDPKGTGETGTSTTQTGTSGTGETGTTGTAETGTSSTGTTSTSRNQPPGRDLGNLTGQKPGIIHSFRDGHDSDVVAVAISHDLNLIASADANGIVVTRSLAEDGKILDQFEVGDKLLGIAFNSTCNRYAVLTPKTIYVRDFENQNNPWRERQLLVPEFTCITHCPFTNFYLTGRLDGTAVLRGRGESGNVNSRPRLVGHEEPVTAVGMSASGRLAVTASEDRTLRIWHMDSRKEIAQFPVDAVIKKVAISPDERRVIGLSKLGIHSWDLFTQRPYPVQPTLNGDDCGIALISDKPFAMTTGSDSAMTVYNLKTLAKTKPITASAGFPMRLMAVSPDGTAAVTAGLYPDASIGADSVVSVWRLPELNEVTFGAPDELPLDILPLVNTDRDVVRGDWTYDGELLTSGQRSTNQLHLPASVPLEYTLHMTVRRSNGMGSLNIDLPFHDTIARLIINGDGGRFSGLEFVDGKPLKEAQIGLDYKWIVSWKNEHTIRATVTEKGITAMVGRNVLFEWEGTPDQLREHPGRAPKWPFVRELALQTGQAQYEFSSIQLLPVGGDPQTATSTGPLVSATKPIVNQIEMPADADLTTEKERLQADLAELYAETKNRPTLIAQLVKLAGESQDAPATQYAALSEAATLASEAGDATQSFLMLDQLTDRFEGQHFALKETVFSSLSKKRDQGTMAQLVLFGFNWVEDLMDADEYDQAGTILSRVRGAAVRLKNARLRELADYLNTRIRTLSRAFEPVKPSLAKLESDPDDSAAAEAVGRFRCFVQEDWERGLPLLEKSDNATLKQLALQDLAGPLTSIEQTALADAWWAFSATQPSAVREAIRRRAGKWYMTAILRLPSTGRAEVLAKEQRVTTVPATVTIAAKVDAGDRLIIRRDGAIWESPQQKPGDVYINRFPWDVRSDKVLLNRGANRFLPTGVHFSRATLQKLQGRSDVGLDITPDEITIKFNDGYSGAGIYQLLLKFGS